MSIKSVMPFSRLILCHPFSSCPQSLPASGSFPVSQLFTRGGQCIGVSASESVLPMNTFRVSPSNEHPGLISFRIDWLDLLAVQGTLKSLLQHHSSKASIYRRPAFFTAQLSHPYVTTGKTIALTRQTFVDKIMSLLFNSLGWSYLSSKEQASFNIMAGVTIWSDFGAQENKVCHCLHCFPIYLP